MGDAAHTPVLPNGILRHVVAVVDEPYAAAALVDKVEAAIVSGHPDAPFCIVYDVIYLVEAERIWVGRGTDVTLHLAVGAYYVKAVALRADPDAPAPVFVEGVYAV